ncbi:MAG TPA: hypothetical protein VLH60_05100 [Sedimentisphaerales bacterium]|nr:hypothetical protein [Sedimentisphaerales bacterium]
MDTIKEYAIGDKTYQQKPLVLGQVKQLRDVMKGLEIPAGVEPTEMIGILGDRLPLALAIVLTERGKSPRAKNVAELAGELEFSITPEQILEVIADFFSCNPLSSVLERLAGLMDNLGRTMATTRIGSQKSVSSSETETSQSATESSGA